MLARSQILPSLPSARYPRRMTERAEIIERAVEAYRALGELAETIEDEWQYVVDLEEAYEPGLEALAEGAPLRVPAVAAIEAAIEEIGLIEDPHKAIDWLSTFPHVIALALDGDMAGEGSASTGAGATRRRCRTRRRLDRL